jgi:hypothetical protein
MLVFHALPSANCCVHESVSVSKLFVASHVLSISLLHVDTLFSRTWVTAIFCWLALYNLCSWLSIHISLFSLNTIIVWGPVHFQYLNRRCIRADECRNMSRPRERNYDLRLKPYKPFNDSCILECPAGYVETEDGPNKYSCTACKGECCSQECLGFTKFM